MSSPDPVGRVLVVCTANICRSPVAELLLRSFVDREGVADRLEVGSAGTHARPGQPVAPGMVEATRARGLDLSGHRSRRVDLALVERHDLVVTMERAHRSAVARLGPTVAERTFTLTELVALVDRPADDALPVTTAGPVSDDWPDVATSAGAGHGSPLADAVRGWHRARVRHAVPADDVADPYGGPAEGYGVTAWELARLVEVVGPALVAAVTRP